MHQFATLQHRPQLQIAHSGQKNPCTETLGPDAGLRKLGVLVSCHANGSRMQSSDVAANCLINKRQVWNFGDQATRTAVALLRLVRESRNPAVKLPEFDIATVDVLLCRFNCGLVVRAIKSDRFDGMTFAVQSVNPILSP